MTDARFERRTLPPFVRRFLETEAAGGIVLVVAAVIALVWANSPWRGGSVMTRRCPEREAGYTISQPGESWTVTCTCGWEVADLAAELDAVITWEAHRLQEPVDERWTPGK